MQRSLSTLASRRFDLLVIGGGIFGAGVARDAAMRGMTVALVEKGDFAGGTSSRSSKLIHGGLRYLEQYNFRLVRESLRERQILREMAPHLVKPCEFLFPVYQRDARPLWMVRAGLTLYDWLAKDQRLGEHRAWSVGEVAEREPGLDREGLRGAVSYFDCQEDDARFCLETIFDAARQGAVCANYCELVGLKRHQGVIDVATVRDSLTGEEFEIEARRFVNAAGPWVERVAGLGQFDTGSVALSPTKGVHLVVLALTQHRAVTLQARRDGRVMFVIPWHQSYSLVGTTDTDWRGDPTRVHAEAADIDYLLGEAQAAFPGKNLKRPDIVTTFAGIRPLLKADESAPSARSREERTVQHAANFFTLAGGKYTTFRLVAEQLVNQFSNVPCRTATTPLPAGVTFDGDPVARESDVWRACDEEAAMTVTDVMRRRLPLALTRRGDVAMAETVSYWMAERLGWTEAQRQFSLAEYAAEWKANQA